MASGLKTDTLTFRCAPEEKSLIEQASVLMHTDITGFVLKPAVERAREIVDREQVTILSEASRDLFISLLTSPPPPSNTFIENILDERHQIVE